MIRRPTFFVTLGTLATAVAAFSAFTPAAAPAAVSTAMPTCASGDPVVWENSKSKVYHAQGDSYYGKTKSGSYACRSAATAAGYHLAGSKSSGSSASASGTSAPDATGSSAPTTRHRHHKGGMTSTPAPAPDAT